MIKLLPMNISDRTGVAFAALILSALTLAACDLTVENPGPTPDNQLNQEIAVPSVVAGMERAMAEALNYIAYEGGAVSLEINAAGSIDNFGISTAERRGDLNPGESNGTWELGHRARFTAEDGVRRIREVLGDGFASSEMAARALLWVGYSNRLLGANFCKAVVDGGPAQPNDEHFSRAEAAFTEALQIAQNAGNAELENAALAGRASVNVHQGDWPDAVADAEQVPIDFEYAISYFGDAQEQYNRIYWANANEPYRAHTVADTYYGPDATDDEDLVFAPVDGSDYYGTTGDSRVPYDPDPAEEFGDTGDIIWYPQLKHDARESPITLSSGDEMMLIIAENEIREGRWPDAMTMINDLRASVPNDNTGTMGVESRTASTETEAWAHLKRERGIELWLEGRRLGDRRRWIENGVPGAQEDMSSRDLCWPISQTELESNPNVSPADNDQDRAN